ncbi:MAG: tetratricopeptide repeat protein, partial [Oleiphilaceae bacterium]|nr:tetratricopeptide repeat protein [Oleiphilaceae bacterium]
MRKIPGKPTSGAVPGLLIVWLLFFSLPLVGCTPPTEQAERYYQNGMALLLEKKPAKATLEFQNSLQIVDSMPMATYGLALAAEQQEDWRKMFRLLNEFLEAEPGHWKAQLKRGQLLLAGSDIDAAFEASNITLHLAPEEAEVLAFRAAVFFKLGKPDEAEGFALAALALAPGNVEASTIMANELVAVGQFREAIAYLDQALQYAPEHIGLS